MMFRILLLAVALSAVAFAQIVVLGPGPDIVLPASGTGPDQQPAVATTDYSNCARVKAVKPNADNTDDSSCQSCAGQAAGGYPCNNMALCYCSHGTDGSLYLQPAEYVKPLTYCGPEYGTTAVKTPGSFASNAQCLNCNNWDGLGDGGTGDVGSYYYPCNEPLPQCECVDLPVYGPNIFSECEYSFSHGRQMLMGRSGEMPYDDTAPNPLDCGACVGAPDGTKNCDNNFLCQCYPQPYSDCASGLVETLSGSFDCQSCYGNANYAPECTGIVSGCACARNPAANLYASCELGAVPGPGVPVNELSTTICSQCASGIVPREDFLANCMSPGACECVGPPPPQPFLDCVTGLVESVSGDSGEDLLCQACVDPLNFNSECLTEGDVCRCVDPGDNLFTPGRCTLGVKPIDFYGPDYLSSPDHVSREAVCASCYEEEQLTSGNWQQCSALGSCQCEYLANDLYGACETGEAEPTGFPPGSWGDSVTFGYTGPATAQQCAECLTNSSAGPYCSAGDACRCVPPPPPPLPPGATVNLYGKCAWRPVNATPLIANWRCATCHHGEPAESVDAVCYVGGNCKCGSAPEGVLEAARAQYTDGGDSNRNFDVRWRESRGRFIAPSEQREEDYVDIPGQDKGRRPRLVRNLASAMNWRPGAY